MPDKPIAKNQSLIEGYSKLDSTKDGFQSFNTKDKYQINLYLAPNFLNDSNRFSLESAVQLKWLTDVNKLILHEKLFDFGISGFAFVLDNQGNLNYILEQFISYDLVIDITHKLDDNSIIRYEPYIMSIINVEEAEVRPGGAKLLKIEFEDILTAEAKRHSIGTLMKVHSDIKDTPSFPELYVLIFDYLSGFIHENSAEQFTYGKEVRFNTYKENDVRSLVKIIFDNIDPEKSIYDLLMTINRTACMAIYPDSDVIQNFEMIGDVMVPLFFKEEYPDMVNYYYTLHSENNEDFSQIKGTTESLYIPRPFTLRNFYSPFVASFQASKNGDIIVFESFSTSSEIDNKTKIETINGTQVLPVRNVQTLSANTNLTTTRWKNLALISCNAQGGSNKLIYFHWIYEFFNQVFLRNKLASDNIKLSNVAPNFYLAQQGNDALMNDQDIAEKNSNIVLLKNESDDPLKEILMQIGKSIASLVFLNNLYSFETEGNLLRRPNEIVNLFTPHDNKASASQPVRTDFMQSDNVVLYVTEVIHSFDHNNFTDKVVCNRIYEQVPAKSS